MREDMLDGRSNFRFPLVGDPRVRLMPVEFVSALTEGVLKPKAFLIAHHTPSGGAVRWGVDCDSTILFVEDEGPGIPQDELPLVTQRFFRGRHKSASGSGLGLAIVDLAIRRSGSTLKLRNRVNSRGLRAEIKIPTPDAFSMVCHSAFQ